VAQVSLQAAGKCGPLIGGVFFQCGSWFPQVTMIAAEIPQGSHASRQSLQPGGGCHTGEWTPRQLLFSILVRNIRKLIAAAYSRAECLFGGTSLHRSLSEIQALKPLGVILSGGPSSVYDADAPAAMRGCWRWRAGAWHLLRAALYCASPGGQGESAPLRNMGMPRWEIEDTKSIISIIYHQQSRCG